MPLGKTINLFLIDGTAAGRYQAKLSNWNGFAYKIPRKDLKKCDDSEDLRKDLKAPGVYFLFGKDETTHRPFIYVGEADDVLKRLNQAHTFEKDGSSWMEAVAFVTPDGTLEKGRVKYLENKFYHLAKDAKNYAVKNANTPKKSPVSRQVQDLLEGFILNVKLVLPVLGYKPFDVAPPDAQHKEKLTADSLLYFSRNGGKGGKATGKLASDGFWVLKGSFIYPETASYANDGIKKARLKYANRIDDNGILLENIRFNSPSYAAGFVCGKNVNGQIDWKNKDGVSLKNLDIKAIKPSRQSVSPSRAENTGEVSEKEVLHLAGKKVSATGYPTGNGFVVCKGSGFFPTETRSCQPWIKNQRAELLNHKIVVDGVFTEDVLFKSPSAAAACIIGSSVSGNKMWLNADGKSIKDKN